MWKIEAIQGWYILNKQNECFVVLLALFWAEVCIKFGITAKGGCRFNRYVHNYNDFWGCFEGRKKITDVIRMEQKKFPFKEYKIPLQSLSYFEPVRSSIWAHGEWLLANL